MKKITRTFKFLQILCFACLSFFLTTNLKAQADSKEKSLSLFFGYHSNNLQDLVFSPLIYRGSSVNAIGLAYERRTNKSLFQVEFAYDRVELEPNTMISSPAFGTRAASENQELRLQLA